MTQTTDLAALNARFGNAAVQVKTGPGGMPVVEVANARAAATIVLQGAHLTRWAPAGAKPVIWLSDAAKFAPGKSIRGGVPVCWPWFGPHESRTDVPAHGYARTVPWELTETHALSADATRLQFRLLESDATRAQWLHPCELTLQMTVGATLELELTTHNTGNNAFTLGEALHTYFEVSDVRQIRVQGVESLAYIDKVAAGARKQQQGAIAIDGEVDRIYLNSTADCVIEDPQWRRRIRISKTGSGATVVWNPGRDKADKMGDLGTDGYLRMVCVESANAADNVVQLAPGDAHRLSVRYSVEAL